MTRALQQTAAAASGAASPSFTTANPVSAADHFPGETHMFIELNRRTGARAFIAPSQIVALTDARVRAAAIVTLSTGEQFEVIESVDTVLEMIQGASQVQFDSTMLDGDLVEMPTFDPAEFIAGLEKAGTNALDEIKAAQDQFQKALQAKDLGADITAEVNKVLADLGYEAGAVLTLTKRLSDVEDLLTKTPEPAPTTPATTTDAPAADQAVAPAKPAKAPKP